MKKIFGKLWAGSLDDALKTLRGKVECLTALESDNLAAVKNAEIQPGKKRKREVELWFTNVKEKQSELKQIEVEIREQVGYSTNLKSRIEKETKEVEELTQQGKFPKGVVLDDHASTRLPMVASRLVGQSCTENTESILRLLKEKDVFGIGIYGMGGVGKTTLVKAIHNFLLSDTDIGRRVYWVTASRDCSLEKLQNEIGKAVGLKDISQKDNERRKALLFQRFVEMGKSVLIIDDLWKHYLPELIGIPLEPCGCKIVLTTRSLDVCRKMGCQQIIKIEPLLKLDAWKLFVEKRGAIPSDLNKFAEEIVSECGGLPLALITMGCCMRGKDDVHDWKNALYELRRPVRRHDDMEEEVFRVLEFSFDNLKDEKVQNCFLSCVLFPEDESIKRDELVDLWIDEGLLDEVENRQDRVIRGHAILNRLIYLCLLESSGDRYVKMHDLLRDMAIIITQKDPLFFAKSGLQLERVPEEKLWSNDLVKVSLGWNKIKEIPFGMAPLTPHLTVLILKKNPLNKIPESFFEHMKSLKVLDLSNTFIKRLPESVSKLENLRALLLVYCVKLTYVPPLEKLTKLEVLNFKNCEELTYVPSVEKLIELRVLNCAPLTPHLTVLILQRNPLKKIPESFFEHMRALKVLDLSYTVIKRLPESVSKLDKLRVLLLVYCVKLTYLPPLEKLTKLKVLNVQHCMKLTYVPSVEKLTELTVLNCGSLGEFIEAPKGIERLKCLEKVRNVRWDKSDITGFNKLIQSSPTLNCYRFWLQLSIDLNPSYGFGAFNKIFKCDKGVLITGLGLEDEETSYLLPTTIKMLGLVDCDMEGRLGDVFPTLARATDLQELLIKCCPGLIKVELGGWSSSLRNLTISGCRGLKVVIPFAQHLCLPNLESLSVEECDELEEIFESNKGTQPNPILSLPKLKYLTLKHLPKLNCIYRGAVICISIPRLQIRACPKVKLFRLSSSAVLVDVSQLTLASVTGNPEVWQMLERDYPQDADDIRHHINQNFWAWWNCPQPNNHYQPLIENNQTTKEVELPPLPPYITSSYNMGLGMGTGMGMGMNMDLSMDMDMSQWVGNDLEFLSFSGQIGSVVGFDNMIGSEHNMSGTSISGSMPNDNNQYHSIMQAHSPLFSKMPVVSDPVFDGFDLGSSSSYFY